MLIIKYYPPRGVSRNLGTPLAYAPAGYSAKLYARKAVISIDIIKLNIDFKATDENMQVL